MSGISYAWCFSHGCIHRFVGEPWCTATWVPLEGETEEQAMSVKEGRYGSARFLHDLPDEQQLATIEGRSS